MIAVLDELVASRLTFSAANDRKINPCVVAFDGGEHIAFKTPFGALTACFRAQLYDMRLGAFPLAL